MQNGQSWDVLQSWREKKSVSMNNSVCSGLEIKRQVIINKYIVKFQVDNTQKHSSLAKNYKKGIQKLTDFTIKHALKRQCHVSV